VSWLLKDYEGTVRDVAQHGGENGTVVVEHLVYLCPGQVADRNFIGRVRWRGSQGTGWLSRPHKSMAA